MTETLRALGGEAGYRRRPPGRPARLDRSAISAVASASCPPCGENRPSCPAAPTIYHKHPPTFSASSCGCCSPASRNDLAARDGRPPRRRPDHRARRPGRALRRRTRAPLEPLRHPHPGRDALPLAARVSPRSPALTLWRQKHSLTALSARPYRERAHVKSGPDAGLSPAPRPRHKETDAPHA